MSSSVQKDVWFPAHCGKVWGDAHITGHLSQTLTRSELIHQVCFHQTYCAFALIHTSNETSMQTFLLRSTESSIHAASVQCKFLFNGHKKGLWELTAHWTYSLDSELTEQLTRWTCDTAKAWVKKKQKQQKKNTAGTFRRRYIKALTVQTGLPRLILCLRLCQFWQLCSWSDTFYSSISRWHHDPPEMTSLWQPPLKASCHFVRFDSVVAATIDPLTWLCIIKMTTLRVGCTSCARASPTVMHVSNPL